MPKIKHIAIATQDADKTAKFYIDVFGMKEISQLDSPTASGYFLSDGDINLAILNFRNADVAGSEYGLDYSGLHHIGFQVENLEEIAERMANAGHSARDDMNNALSMGRTGSHGNVEHKFGGPDGVVVDVSATGWAGTSPMDK